MLVRSHEVLKQAAETVGVKALAAALKLSPALVYKWCQEFDPNDADGGGALNPLDRLAQIVHITGDREVVNWLCHQAGGFFVANPAPATDRRAELLSNTQRLVQEFSRLLTTVTRSIEDDGVIEPREAQRIRSAWEHLKGVAEAFCIACERGFFQDTAEAGPLPQPPREPRR